MDTTRQVEEQGSFSYRHGQNAQWLIICDHASNRVPAALGSLGLGDTDLQSHIAYDIGAAWVARRLALLLDAPCILSNVSRLVIDCNRYPTAHDSVPEISGGCTITGNLDLASQERNARRQVVFLPYHRAVEAAIRSAESSNLTPAVISVHSCTPVLGPKPRPWHVGISWARDSRMSAPIIEQLRAVKGTLVGDNEPYSLDIGEDFSVPEHAMSRGLAHLQIEFRQDLVSTKETAYGWAEQLYRAIQTTPDTSRWHRREDHLLAGDNIKGAQEWL